MSAASSVSPVEVTARLAAPFDPSEVHWKPQAVSGNRALAIAYVDARSIMDRLDMVLGIDGWTDRYHIQPDGSVICWLRCKIGDRWITKTDVGSPSEQQDGGDRTKASFSDAIKRAAVKFGVGRYLYRLPSQWCDYDSQRRQFKSTPKLPDWARPAAGKEKPRDTTPIGLDGGKRLQALADQKGQRLQSWLEPHLDRAAFISLDQVPTWAARLAWRALEKLPDANSANVNGTAAGGTVNLDVAAAAAPIRTSRVPF
jgi:hypothetical protein